jgi:amino acid efflux transporter
MGPGVLLIPALAVEAAGPASLVAYVALLVLSAPLALTFAALGVRHPVAGGVTAYVRAGLGRTAASATTLCFLTAIVLGAPAVALVGGYYVADLAGGGTLVAVAAGAGMTAAVLVANAFGVRVSASAQLALSGVLVVVLAIAIAFALPAGQPGAWRPFAPHGWWAIGTAASLLAWLFIGWEAMAQWASEFRDPRRDLPRAVALAYATIAVLYLGLGLATVAVAPDAGSKVPLADLLDAGLGNAGRTATLALALALTMGTMNVYLAGASRLASSLAAAGELPGWLAPARRPLAAIAGTSAVVLGALAAGVAGPDDLVRVTSACFIAVYLLALTSAVRILAGAARVAALAALALSAVLAAFSALFLAVPAAAAGAAVLQARLRARRRRAVEPDAAACAGSRDMGTRGMHLVAPIGLAVKREQHP